MKERSALQRFLRGFCIGMASGLILLFILSAIGCVGIEYKPVDLCEFHMECI